MTVVGDTIWVLGGFALNGTTCAVNTQNCVLAHNVSALRTTGEVGWSYFLEGVPSLTMTPGAHRFYGVAATGNDWLLYYGGFNPDDRTNTQSSNTIPSGSVVSRAIDAGKRTRRFRTHQGPISLPEDKRVPAYQQLKRQVVLGTGCYAYNQVDQCTWVMPASRDFEFVARAYTPFRSPLPFCSAITPALSICAPFVF